MPTVVFGSLAFDAPTKTLTATSLNDVLPLLQWAEREARAGSYVALTLSYEASPAFDRALTTHEPTDFPLAWAAAFASAAPVESDKATAAAQHSWCAKVSREEYNQAISRIRELIAAGDTYQVNYSFPLTGFARKVPKTPFETFGRGRGFSRKGAKTQSKFLETRQRFASLRLCARNLPPYRFLSGKAPLTSSLTGDTYAWYRDLCAAQGAQYSAYLDLGRFKVLCLSPELFFERRGDHVKTKPMKGTIHRGRWLAEDLELAESLRVSAKDRAENVMIVDLLRNDLGKVSTPGSVRVSSLFDVERFETVWQMTSTVEATLKEDTSLADLLTALFPCGSITGAPKIRTMQIIRELERFPRGAYTGTIGILKPGGECIFNVAIRTVVVDTRSGLATFGVGGGVTIDSTAEREYEECLVKTRFLNSSAAEFQLFESILLEDGEYFLLERHLERLRDSAAYFGFAFPAQQIRLALRGVANVNNSESHKVRVTLWKDGRVNTETSPVKSGRQIVSLANTPVDSADRFLFHKTTRRPGGENLIFWNERGEITESSIANVVVEIDGELYTPPVSSGLLPGTFRNQLLAEGKIKERVITIAELQQAQRFFLINSVRKWISAELRPSKEESQHGHA